MARPNHQQAVEKGDCADFIALPRLHLLFDPESDILRNANDFGDIQNTVPRNLSHRDRLLTATSNCGQEQ